MASDPPTLPLPQELIDHVIELLAESGVAQLQNVSLASRSLSISCQPHQFKRLTIDTCPADVMKRARMKISVFKRNPALLQHVRTLTIHVRRHHCNESISISNFVDNVSNLSFVLDNLSKVQKATLTCKNTALDKEASPTVAASFFGFLTSNPLHHLTLRAVHIPSSFLNCLPPTLVSLSTYDCWITSHETAMDPPRTTGALQAMKKLHFDGLIGTFNLALLKQVSAVAPAIRSVYISLEPGHSDGYGERVVNHRETLASLPSTIEELFVNIDLAQGHWEDPRDEYRAVFAPSFQPIPHPTISRFDFALTLIELLGNVSQLTETAVHYLVSTRLLSTALTTVTLRYYFVIIPHFSESECGIVDGGFLEARGLHGALFPRQMYLAQLDDHLADRKAVPGLRQMNVVVSFLTFGSNDRTCPK